jgi:large subunit ribosomal protein L43
MPIKPIARLPVIQNGVGAFVLHCKRIVLQFDKTGGSSQGLRDFLKLRLDRYAQSNPKIEFRIVQKSGHPVIKGEYANGREKAICIRNLNVDVVQNKLNLLKDSSGEQLRKRNSKVESINESVRGIWSPLHVDPTVRHKV